MTDFFFFNHMTVSFLYQPGMFCQLHQLIVDFLAQNTALDGRECCIDLKSMLFLSNGITSSPGGGTPANFG